MAENEERRNGGNRRNRKRVGADKLPPGLRKFRLNFGSNGVYIGTTIDASQTSISFLVEVPPNRISEHLVKLTSADGKIRMTQELVYIKAIDPSHARISFMLESGSTPELYRKLIGTALKE